MATQQPESLLSIDDFDETFIKIIEGLGGEAVSGSASCTESIFKLSSSYLGRPTINSLKKFYDLYFGAKDAKDTYDSVNQGVDALVSQAQEALDKGESITAIEEDQEARDRRLSIAAVQKQLEGLIRLNAGIREEIIPALSSMQFEDAVSQRIVHITVAWRKIKEFLDDGSCIDASDLAKELAQDCSSVNETAAYYEIVLEQAPPEGQEQRSIFLEF